MFRGHRYSITSTVIRSGAESNSGAVIADLHAADLVCDLQSPPNDIASPSLCRRTSLICQHDGVVFEALVVELDDIPNPTAIKLTDALRPRPTLRIRLTTDALSTALALLPPPASRQRTFCVLGASGGNPQYGLKAGIPFLVFWACRPNIAIPKANGLFGGCRRQRREDASHLRLGFAARMPDRCGTMALDATPRGYDHRFTELYRTIPY